ncbi:MAG: hypothetical protein JO337_06700, partial [Acidimicrobiales bacterium]|nr:hypothetical protein [Acidimicrobiales bacterium]
MRLGPVGTGRAGEIAAWLLRGLGAEVGTDSEPATRLVPGLLPEEGLPAGTGSYAVGVALAAAALAGWRWGRPLGVSET